MATQVATTVPVTIDAILTDASDERLGQAALCSGFNTASAVGSWQGVRPSGGNPLLCAYSAGMALTVNAGPAVIQGTDSTQQGVYQLALPAQQTLTCTTSDPTNDRRDLVVAQVVDLGTSSSTYLVRIVPGTPAASPVDPNPGTNWIPLARVTVLHGSSSISGQITDLRQWAVAAGGITPVASSAAYPTAGPAGTYFHDLATGALGYWDGAATHLLRSAQLLVNRADGNGLATGATPTQIQWAGSAVLNHDFGTYPGTPTNFTLPADGPYDAKIHVTFSSNSTGERRVHIKQGSTFYTHNQNAVTGDATHMHLAVTLNGHAGDIVGFYTDQNSSSTLTLSNQFASLSRIV